LRCLEKESERLKIISDNRLDGEYYMSQTFEHLARNTALAIHEPVSVAVSNAFHIDDEPKVVITGDLRLHITTYDAAHCPTKGHYRIATEGLQSPLHIVWIVDGHMLSQCDSELEIAFDMRGRAAGETLTRQLSVQVTALAGQGPIVHSSVFIQIVVVPNDIQVAIKNDSQKFYTDEHS
jgi:hypothetical protein